MIRHPFSFIFDVLSEEGTFEIRRYVYFRWQEIGRVPLARIIFSGGLVNGLVLVPRLAGHDIVSGLQAPLLLRI